MMIITVRKCNHEMSFLELDCLNDSNSLNKFPSTCTYMNISGFGHIETVVGDTNSNKQEEVINTVFVYGSALPLKMFTDCENR